MPTPSQRVHPQPRISTNDLALFMVSSDTARVSIVERAKYPITPPIIRYRDARPAIIQFLTDANRSLKHLVKAEEMFKQRIDDPASGGLRLDDARRSIEVLHAVQGMSNQLGAFDFLPAPQNQAMLVLGGVEVSFRADFIVHGAVRSRQQIGVAMLRLTQSDAESDAARAKRRDMGEYVATMARLHAEQNIQSDREPASRLCLSIDVQHGEAFACPASNVRRRNDLESACRFIAAMWPGV